MDSGITPFKGRRATGTQPTRLLKQFAKSGHVAEIRERIVTAFNAVEFIVFVDGSLVESQMFHGQRLRAYVPAIEVRAKQFADKGWLETPMEASIDRGL